MELEGLGVLWALQLGHLGSKEHLDWLKIEQIECNQNNHCSRLKTQKINANGSTHIQC